MNGAHGQENGAGAWALSLLLTPGSSTQLVPVINFCLVVVMAIMGYTAYSSSVSAVQLHCSIMAALAMVRLRASAQFSRASKEEHGRRSRLADFFCVAGIADHDQLVRGHLQRSKGRRGGGGGGREASEGRKRHRAQEDGLTPRH